MSARVAEMTGGTATTRALLADGRAALAAAGLAAPGPDAEWLLADLAGCERFRLRLDDVTIAADAADAYRRRIQRRARHEPRQHILGWEEFCGVRVGVSLDVLIPRQETEGLVAWALELLPAGGLVWDVGTGSGCIACALASARPDCRVVASDRSDAAVVTAAANVRRLGLDARVRVIGADLFDVDGTPGGVDVVVANPPYIPTAVLVTLPEEVRSWDPSDALDGGVDGLAVSSRIIAGAPCVLRPDGWLVMEIGESQASALSTLFRASAFSEIAVRRDLTNRERYIAARRSSAAGAGR